MPITWRKLLAGTTNLRGLACNFDSSIILATNDISYSLYVSSDGGLTWVERTNPFISDPASGFVNWGLCDSVGNVMVIAGYTDVYVSSDRGLSWSRKKPRTTGNYYFLGAANETCDILFVWSANNGRFYLSTNKGDTWTETQPMGDRDGNPDGGIACSADGTTLYACCKDSLGALPLEVRISNNCGASWAICSPTGTGVFGEWGPIATDYSGSIVAVSDRGYHKYTSEDRGLTWVSDTEHKDESYMSCSNDGKTILAGGFSNGAYINLNLENIWSKLYVNGDGSMKFSDNCFVSKDGKKILMSEWLIDGDILWLGETTETAFNNLIAIMW